MVLEHFSPLAGRAMPVRGLLAASGVLLMGVAASTATPPVSHNPLPASLAVGGTPIDGATLTKLGEITASAKPLAQGHDAMLRNLAQPVIQNGLEVAPSFRVPLGATNPAIASAQQCLALAMYYEAGFEGHKGRLAVGQVVLNRVRHPAFPHRVCDVVFQRSEGVCQFSFACDGAMGRTPVEALWRQTLAEASALLSGKVAPEVGMATHYHANYVMPAWAPRLDKIAVIGAHIFYRWPDGWGRRSEFSSRYDGVEMMPSLASKPIAPAPDEAADGEDATANLDTLPRRIPGEGGYVDPSKGWKPKISDGS